jgi:hypothetical protein
MSIVYISVDEAAEVGELPRTNKMITTDSLSSITTAGYLNHNNTSGRPIFPTDVWHIQYSYTGNSFAQQAGFGTGTFGIFTTTISTAGQITLVQWTNPGNVLLPVTAGNLASFNGTTGQIQDAGVSLQYLNVPLTLAQWIGMYATPQLIIPGPPLGKIIRVDQSMIYMTYGSAQLTNSGSGYVFMQYGNTAHQNPVSAATNGEAVADFNQATVNTNFWSAGNIGSSATSINAYMPDVSATGVYITNSGAPFAGGTGASFNVHAWYYVASTP